MDACDGAGTRLRVHYLDERGSGKPSGETVLLLHGEPSWSYLYRHMIAPLADAGHRVVVPDLVGFGRSDKPADRAAYTYQRHLDWLREAVFDRLELREVTMFCQDWGGLLGLRPNRRALKVLETLDTPFLCAFSDQDWDSRGEHRHLSDRIPGAKGQPHRVIRGSGVVGVVYALIRTDFLTAVSFPGPIFGVILGLPILGLAVAEAVGANRDRRSSKQP